MRIKAALASFLFIPLWSATLVASPSLPTLPVPPDHRGELDSIPIDPAPEPDCKVTATVLRGTAEVEKNDGGCGSGRSLSTLSSGDSFGTDARVTTSNGSLVELLLPDGSVVRIGPNSELTIDAMQCEAGDPPFALRLESGSMWSRVTPATGGEIKMNVETRQAVTEVRGSIFMVEMFDLDTVFQQKLADLYPPEYKEMVESLDTTMTIAVPFKGTVTRVVVFGGSVNVTDQRDDKSIVVGAGQETMMGVESVPKRVVPARRRNGFDGDGEFGK